LNYTIAEDTIQLKRPSQRIILTSGEVSTNPQYYRDPTHRPTAIELAKCELAERLGVKVEDLVSE
jgi:hypothetical protein